jgi:hypothetical protein
MRRPSSSRKAASLKFTFAYDPTRRRYVNGHSFHDDLTHVGGLVRRGIIGIRNEVIHTDTDGVSSIIRQSVCIRHPDFPCRFDPG